MKSIRLTNYKCFEDTGAVSLSSLNFLVGSNSSGKSSFLEFFPLLQQSVKVNRDGAFLWVGNNVDLDNFYTIVRNRNGSIGVEFCIDKIPLMTGNIKPNAYLGEVVLRLEISPADIGDNISRFSISFNKQVIDVQLNENSSDLITINGESLVAEEDKVFHTPTNSLLPRLLFDMPGMEWCSRRRRKELFEWFRKNTKEDDKGIPEVLAFRLRHVFNRDRFDNMLEHKMKDDVTINNLDHVYNLALLYNINDIIDLLNFYMMELSDRIEFIQPLRASAERYYRKRNISVNKISPSGDNIAMFFLRLKKEDRLTDFNDWLQKNEMGFSADLNEEGGFVELRIIEDGKDSRNMMDVGFGYSQILPILATIWKDLYYDISRSGRVTYCSTSIILIEQPELHLHPRFQKKFAELLIKCIKQARDADKDIRFIIETHSQDIINSVGLSVAYGLFDPSWVNVYIFNAQRENMKKYIERASYTKDGFLDNWPVGFFD